jgi:hypothetical protein
MSLSIEGSEGPKVEEDPSCFDKKVLFIQAYQKVSSLLGIEKLKVKLSTKAWFCIPSCRMVSMPIVCPALLVDIQKMEASF